MRKKKRYELRVHEIFTPAKSSTSITDKNNKNNVIRKKTHIQSSTCFPLAKEKERERERTNKGNYKHPKFRKP